MARIRSFPPIEDAAARTLILGTMPGVASLTAKQYYAHPRNVFWSIMGSLLGFDPNLDYATRTRLLIANGIAVWDVLQSCRRFGSLDSDIEPESIVANDFDRFFGRHPHIQHVYFNGASAEGLYRRHVLRNLPLVSDRVYRRLPSTSPANASISLIIKVSAWRAALAPRSQNYTNRRRPR